MEIPSNGKNGLGTLIGKYKHFGQDVQQAILENKKSLARLKRVTENALYTGQAKVKDVAFDAKRTVKKNPWAYIGAASAFGMLLGFMIGKKK